jgi:NAD(P)-dependent dehydrogenase (short-subunit alcohol dehydrogenase family)
MVCRPPGSKQESYPMPTVAIIGASRGIGLELARQYADAGWRVHATHRGTVPGDALAALAGDVRLHELDVTDAGRIGALAATLAGESLDVLIHNAGIKDGGNTREQVMTVNARAPLAVCEALFDSVARAGGRIVLMSNQLGARRGQQGSLGDYGDSKAALNDGFRKRASRWGERGVVAVVMHPGWVRTDMGGAGAPVSVSDSASGIRRVIDGLTPAQHGHFLTWEGREHPW